MFRILLTWTFQFEAEEEFCNNGSASKMGFTSWQASRYQILAVSIAFSTGSLIPIFWSWCFSRFWFLVDVLFFAGGWFLVDVLVGVFIGGDDCRHSFEGERFLSQNRVAFTCRQGGCCHFGEGRWYLMFR